MWIYRRRLSRGHGFQHVETGGREAAVSTWNTVRFELVFASSFSRRCRRRLAYNGIIQAPSGRVWTTRSVCPPSPRNSRAARCPPRLLKLTNRRESGPMIYASTVRQTRRNDSRLFPADWRMPIVPCWSPWLRSVPNSYSREILGITIGINRYSNMYK